MNITDLDDKVRNIGIEILSIYGIRSNYLYSKWCHEILNYVGSSFCALLILLVNYCILTKCNVDYSEGPTQILDYAIYRACSEWHCPRFILGKIHWIHSHFPTIIPWYLSTKFLPNHFCASFLDKSSIPFRSSQHANPFVILSYPHSWIIWCHSHFRWTLISHHSFSGVRFGRCQRSARSAAREVY